MREGMQPAPRLIVVSNRLPLTISHSADGSFVFTPSSGGLVSALVGLQRGHSFEWIGWPGVPVESEEQQNEIQRLLAAQFHCHPVFLSDATVEGYCNVFSNSVLWPILHYVNHQVEFDPSAWRLYASANELFASVICQQADDGDLVWIHDYHLMLVPQLLRERLRKKVKIGFFLHTPFPSSEMFRTLPTAVDLIKSLLCCDLVGFHTYDYLRHFLCSCTSLLNAYTMPDFVQYLGRRVTVGVFPIGIDADRFAATRASPAVVQRIYDIRQQHGDKTIILGVERLDYIKGVPNKLIAFERLLRRHPQFVGNVVMLQVAVPSRTDVEEYRALRSSVNELVGAINGRYGSVAYTPVFYLNQSVPEDELAALYGAADICVVSSTRDGMNLIAYEYVASQSPGSSATLIISEFAGAAHSLNGSHIVNCWDLDAFVDVLKESLTQPADQKRQNFAKLFSYVRSHSALEWGRAFVNRLVSSQSVEVQPISHPIEVQTNTLTVIDVPDFDWWRALSPDVRRITDDLIIVLSGDATTLEKSIASQIPNASVVGRESPQELLSTVDQSWKAPVRRLFEWYKLRSRGARLLETATWMQLEFEPGTGLVPDLLMNVERLVRHSSVKVVSSEPERWVKVVWLEADLFVAVKRKIAELLRDGLAVRFMSPVKDRLLDAWYSLSKHCALSVYELRGF